MTLDKVTLVNSDSGGQRIFLLSDLEKHFMNGRVTDDELYGKSEREFENRVYKTKS